MSGYQAYPSASGGRRRRPLRTLLIVVIVLLAVLVAADFAARAVAQNEVATQIKSQGFPKKPDVSIKGFPFLTQLAGRDFHQVTISSGKVPEGPVTLETVDAVLNGVHVNSSFNGATVDRLTGTAVITFPEIANALTSEAGPLGSLVGSTGLTLTSVGGNEVRADVNLLITSFSATWRVTSLSGNVIDVKLVSSNGLPSSVLSSVSNIKVPLSGLPLGLKIDSVTVTPDGVVGHLSGQNVTFGG